MARSRLSARGLVKLALLGVLSAQCSLSRDSECKDAKILGIGGGTGTIVGKVTVAGEDTPIAGAQVDVSIGSIPPPPADFSTVTDAGGNYRMGLGWPETFENPPGLIVCVPGRH